MNRALRNYDGHSLRATGRSNKRDCASWPRSDHTIMAINYGRPGYPAIDGSCTGDVISFSFSEVQR